MVEYNLFYVTHTILKEFHCWDESHCLQICFSIKGKLCFGRIFCYGILPGDQELDGSVGEVPALQAWAA